MATILNFPARSTDISLSLADTELATFVLALLKNEYEKRSELTEILQQYPPLLTDYLTIRDEKRAILDQFREANPHYLIGEGKGYCIQQLVLGDTFFGLRSNNNKVITSLAQRSRYAHQLSVIFAFYQENELERKFNDHYIRTNDKVRKKLGSLGYTLIRNVSNGGFTMGEIANLVRYVHPHIAKAYESPHEKRGEVVQLRRKSPFKKQVNSPETIFHTQIHR